MKKKLVLLEKFSIIKFLNALAFGLAIISVNTTCVWVHHQPQVPSQLLAKRKKDENIN